MLTIAGMGLRIRRHGGHTATMCPAQAGSVMSFMLESPPPLPAISSVRRRSRPSSYARWLASSAYSKLVHRFDEIDHMSGIHFC
jgi:hypothetical protein